MVSFTERIVVPLGSLISLRIPQYSTVQETDFRAPPPPPLPPIPLSLIGRVIDFFRALMEDGEKYEALALIYWDKLNRQYLTYIPKQSCG